MKRMNNIKTVDNKTNSNINTNSNANKIDIYTAHDNIKRYYEVKRTILKQYKSAVQILNNLFDFAPDQSHVVDGIGNCTISKKNSEAGIKGPAESIILQKRDEELKKALSAHQHLMGLNKACPFHKFGEGCILGHLKSPLCTAHYEEGEITETAPSGVSEIVRIVGYAIDTDTLFFDPDKSWVEI